MSHKRTQRRPKHASVQTQSSALRALAAVMLAFMICGNIPYAIAATTLLANTESFETIDAGAGTNVELRFGASSESMYWDIVKAQFDVTDDLFVENNLTTSGSLAVEQNIRTKGNNTTINSDNDAADATLTFGNSTLPQLLSLVNASQKFRFSTSLDVAGTMSGYLLTVSGLRNCDTIDTNANGVFVCGTDSGGSGLTQSDGDARYLKLSGGTLTGALLIKKNAGSGTGNTFIVDTNGLVYDASNKRVGIGTASPKTALEVVGAMSGTSLTVSGITGNTFVLDGNSVVYDATNNRFGINKAAPSTTLDVRGTISGSSLRVSNLVSSGSLLYSSGSKIVPSARGLSGQLLISQGNVGPKWGTPVGGMIWYFDGTQSVTVSKGPQITMPFSVALSGVTLKAKGAPTGAAFIVNIKKDGSTIFSTRPQIYPNYITGGTGAVLSTSVIPTNSSLTLDIDQVGSTFAGSGITIMLTGVRRY